MTYAYTCIPGRTQQSTQQSIYGAVVKSAKKPSLQLRSDGCAVYSCRVWTGLDQSVVVVNRLSEPVVSDDRRHFGRAVVHVGGG